MSAKRKTSRATLIIAALAALAAVSLLVFRVGTRENRDRTYADSLRELIEEGEREYATIPVAPLEGMTLEDVRTALAPMTADGTPLAGATKEQVLDEFAEFLYHRFIDLDPEQYLAWCRSKGRKLLSLEDQVNGPWTVGRSYEYLRGEPLPDDITVEEVFGVFFFEMLEYGNGVNRPVAVSTDPKGLACGFYVRQGTYDYALNGVMKGDLWTGGDSHTYHQWWPPPKSIADLATGPQNQTMCADVGVILEYADGSRRPFIMVFAWDTRNREWVMQHALTYNTNADGLSELTY